MRTALCISGELRSYRETYFQLKKNIINQLKPDIFIYSWDSIGGSWKSRANDNKYNKFFVDHFHNAARGKQLKNDLQTLFSPRSMILETFKENYKNTINNISRPVELLLDPNKNRWSQYNLPMFYTMYHCNQLKIKAELEDKREYDLVIKMRTDIKFPKIPENILKKKTVLWYYPKDHNEAHVVSDKFAFSSSKIMDYYCDVFPRLNDYWSEGMFTSMGKWKIGESLMWYHIYDKSNIKVRSFGNEFYDPIRAHNNKK